MQKRLTSVSLKKGRKSRKQLKPHQRFNEPQYWTQYSPVWLRCVALMRATQSAAVFQPFPAGRGKVDGNEVIWDKNKVVVDGIFCCGNKEIIKLGKKQLGPQSKNWEKAVKFSPSDKLLKMTVVLTEVDTKRQKSVWVYRIYTVNNQYLNNGLIIWTKNIWKKDDLNWYPTLRGAQWLSPVAAGQAGKGQCAEADRTLRAGCIKLLAKCLQVAQGWSTH